MFPTMEPANPSAEPNDDERQWTRVRAGVYVEVETVSGRRVGYVQDLSVGGCFLPCRPPLPAGARCTLRVHVAGPGAEPVIEIDARVAWHTLLGCALEFDRGMTESNQQHLLRLLALHAEGSGAQERDARNSDTRPTGTN